MKQRLFSPGDVVINNKDTHPHLETYFKGHPLKVIASEDGPAYAGGEFVTVKLTSGKEQTFYANALKKIHAS